MGNENYITLDVVDDSMAYIESKYNNFIVNAKIGGENRPVGKFKHKTVAKIVRDLLVENAWDVLFFKNHNIFKYKKTFYVLDLVDFKITFLFKTTSADLAANHLKNSRINDSEVITSNGTDSEISNIKILDDEKYLVYNKNKNGKVRKFGEFPTIAMARRVRNNLMNNGWNVNFFNKNPILQVNGGYATFKVISNKILFLKMFSSKSEAYEFLNNSSSINSEESSNQNNSNIFIESDFISQSFIIKNYNDLSFHYDGGFYWVKDDYNNIFAKFKIKKDAVSFINILNQYKMDYSFFKEDHIFAVRNNFFVFKIRNYDLYFLGVATSISEVSSLLNQGEGIDFEIIHFDESIEKYGPNIKENGNKFEIFKEDRILGSFDSKYVAMFVRDRLNSNNWNIGHFNNVTFKIKGHFYGFLVKSNKIISIGPYSYKYYAQNKLKEYKNKKNVNLQQKLDNNSNNLISNTSTKSSKNLDFQQKLDNNSKNSISNTSTKSSKDVVISKPNMYISHPDEGGKYYINKTYNKKFKSWGKFFNLNVAQFVRDKLIDYDWKLTYFKNNPVCVVDGIEYQFTVEKGKVVCLNENSNDSIINSINELNSDLNSNIYKKDNLFVVKKKKKNKEIIFGKFESEKVAHFVRDKLSENNWKIDYFRKHNIFKLGEKFILLKVFNNELVLWGYFSSEEEAKNSIPYIRYSNKTFYIQKTKNKEMKGFGKFSSIYVAIFIRDKLIENDWNVNYFRNNNIFEIKDKWYLFKVTGNKVKSLDSFESYEEALNFKSNMALNSSSKSNNNSSNLKSNVKVSPWGKNIYQGRGGFIIKKTFNKKTTEYGYFLSNDDAKDVKKVLEDNGWNVEYFKENPILKMGNKFGVLEVTEGVLELNSKFDSIEDAQNFLQNKKSHFESKSNEGADDSFIELEYIVKNNEKVFGRFSSIKHANFIRDKLIENNWDINYFEDNNVFCIRNYHLIFVLKNDEVKFIDSVKLRNDALRIVKIVKKYDF